MGDASRSAKSFRETACGTATTSSPIARIDSPFLGMDAMVCLIEDEPTRWFAYPGPQGGPDRSDAVVVTWRANDVDEGDVRRRRRDAPLLPARAAGPPVVLAHGALDDGRCWTRVAEALESEYDLIAYDARFHGKSDAPGEWHAARRRRPRGRHRGARHRASVRDRALDGGGHGRGCARGASRA